MEKYKWYICLSTSQYIKLSCSSTAGERQNVQLQSDLSPSQWLQKVFLQKKGRPGAKTISWELLFWLRLNDANASGPIIIKGRSVTETQHQQDAAVCSMQDTDGGEESRWSSTKELENHK